MFVIDGPGRDGNGFLMAKFVNVAAVQFTKEHLTGQKNVRALVLEDTAATLNNLRGLRLNLVVLSETIEALAQTIEEAEEVQRPGALLTLYQEFAAAENCHLVGSVKLRDADGVHNSIVFIGPAGRVLGAYHKTFLTISEIEQGLKPGKGAVVVDTAIGRLGGAICFDLNFDELRQQYVKLRPDIITFASMYHGGLMQSSWAYSCRAFFAAALPFHGGGVLDPFGRPIALTDCYTAIARAQINLDRVLVHLDYNAAKFPAIERRYRDEVQINIPPNIGAAMLSSRSEKRTALEIAQEFELQLLDDYFQTAGARNAEARNKLL